MRLVKNVYVDGRWYGPAYGNADQVPEDVAERIANPEAWEGSEPSGGGAATEQRSDGSPSRPEIEARAKELGVSFRANISDETLAERVREAEAKSDDED